MAGINATGNGLNNVLVGNSAANILTGGLGADTLTGGLGGDRFVFTATSESPATTGAWDVITDFSSNQGDKIDVSKIDASPANGQQHFTFIGSAAFSPNATGQLRFDSATHMLYGSTNADSAPELAIQLLGVTGLTAASLVL